MSNSKQKILKIGPNLPLESPPSERQHLEQEPTNCVTASNLCASGPIGDLPLKRLGRRSVQRATLAADVDTKAAYQDQPSEQFVWDPILPGFGIRVLPTGRQVYIVQYRERGRTRRRVIAPVLQIDARMARRRARKILSDVKTGLGIVDPFKPAAAASAITLTDYVEQFWATHARHWAPSTQESSRKLIDRLIVPEFGQVAVAYISRAMVLRWRDSLGSSPGTANRVLPILSVMMKTAEQLGHRRRQSNPCRNVTRFPTKHLERFLSLDEISRLGCALRGAEQRWPQQCAIISLLLLTGARKGEIESLQWSYLDGSFAHLPNSKSGPRTIYLGRPARDVLAGLPRDRDDWVFPRSEGAPGHAEVKWQQWAAIRQAADLDDVRLHDLRHTYASHGVMNGINLPTIGKLLGHALLETSERYAHLSDTSVREAIGRVSGYLAKASGFDFSGDAQ
jgi:integrase